MFCVYVCVSCSICSSSVFRPYDFHLLADNKNETEREKFNSSSLVCVCAVCDARALKYGTEMVCQYFRMLESNRNRTKNKRMRFLKNSKSLFRYNFKMFCVHCKMLNWLASIHYETRQ